ncbi:MAG: cache domain-containing protein [Thermodesulfobacteriota bacterium]
MKNAPTETAVQGKVKSRGLAFYLGIAILLVTAVAACNQSTVPDASTGTSGEAGMREVRELAAVAATLLNAYMDARVTETLVCSKLGGPLREVLTVPEARVEANRVLTEWYKISGAYEAIVLLNEKGVCLASAPEALANRDFSDEEGFKSAVKGQLAITDAHKSDALITMDPKSKGWTVTIAVPVRIENKTVGVLMSFLKWSQVRLLMLSVHVGKTGYVYVLNRENQVIIHPAEQFYGLSLLDPKINRPQVHDAITEKAGNVVYQFKNLATGQLNAKVEGFAYPKRCGHFPGLAWTVGASTHKSEIEVDNSIWRILFRKEPTRLEPQ